MLHFIVSKSESHKVFFSKKVKSGLMSPFNFGSHMQTLAQTREMDQLGQEVHELREEVTTLCAEVDKLTNLSSLMATRDQPSCPQQPRQQTLQRPTAQNQAQRASRFGPISVKYAELFPTLLRENLIQTRLPPPMPKRLSTWYKLDLFCAFHQGAPGHDIEQCFAFRTVVQELIQANTLSPEGQLLVQQRPQQHYPAYQQIVATTPATDATQPPNYQQPQSPNHQHHQPQYPSSTMPSTTTMSTTSTSTTVPTLSTTTISATAASTTVLANCPNPREICGFTSTVARKESGPYQGASSGTSKIASMV